MEYVYIVRCKDGSLYTGWTNDIEGRIKAHNTGKGAKYTKGRRPVTLLFLENFDSKSEALKRERAIKNLSRSDKIKLIEVSIKSELIGKLSLQDKSQAQAKDVGFG